jgi:phospho-N-acetylmuramoyl-pentapeptide-transferase
MGCFLGFGLLGLVDDMRKIRSGSGDLGLSEKTKLALQVLMGALLALAVIYHQSGVPPSEATLLYLPFFKSAVLDLGPVYLPVAVLFVLFVSNSVNLTDGLDGLAITPSIFTAAVLGIFAYVQGNVIYAGYLNYPYFRGAGELMVFAFAFSGAGLAFLWYNAYPAQLFMGDTGALAIGGMLAAMCVLLKQEGLFPIVGGLFVAEALTSQIQDKIGIKWLGKRIFYRAPLHHSLQYKGIAETKVVIRLWIISGICALIALATLKIR